MKTQYRWALVLSAALLWTLAGCDRAKSQAPSANKPPLVATVGYLPMVTSLTHFVAQSEGFYQKHGVTVRAERINTSNLLAQEVVTGHVNVAIELAINPLINAVAQTPHSAQIFSVSLIEQAGGFDGVVVRSDSPLKSLGDLSGKKVGVFPGTTAAAFFSYVFERQFPGKPKPEFLSIAPSLHIQELETGQIDALHAYEPVLTLGMKTRGFRQIAPSIYALDFSPSPIGVAALNREWSRGNPEAARAVVAALDDAVRFIRANPTRAREILATAVQLEPEVARAINIMPMSLSTEIDRSSLEKFIVHLHDLKEIAHIPAVNGLLWKP